MKQSNKHMECVNVKINRFGDLIVFLMVLSVDIFCSPATGLVLRNHVVCFVFKVAVLTFDVATLAEVVLDTQ